MEPQLVPNYLVSYAMYMMYHMPGITKDILYNISFDIWATVLSILKRNKLFIVDVANIYSNNTKICELKTIQ